MADELSERLIDVEVRLAYQDRALNALDDVVRDLVRKVAALEAELAAARGPTPPRAPTES